MLDPHHAPLNYLQIQGILINTVKKNISDLKVDLLLYCKYFNIYSASSLPLLHISKKIETLSCAWFALLQSERF